MYSLGKKPGDGVGNWLAAIENVSVTIADTRLCRRDEVLTVAAHQDGLWGLACAH